MPWAIHQQECPAATAYQQVMTIGRPRQVGTPLVVELEQQVGAAAGQVPQLDGAIVAEEVARCCPSGAQASP